MSIIAAHELKILLYVRNEMHICGVYANSCIYRVIQNDCRDFNNLPPRSPVATPCDFFLWGNVKDQVYVPPLPASIPELKVRIRTAIETITTDMLQTVLERTRLSRWCLKNHKGCTYRAPVRFVTKTWSVVLLNKNTYTAISSVLCMTSCLNHDNHFE